MPLTRGSYPRPQPAVVTLSLGITVGHWSRALEQAVYNLIHKHDLTVIVASGNSGVDSCYVAPANVKDTVTVAASNLSTKFQQTSGFDLEDIYRCSMNQIPPPSPS